MRLFIPLLFLVVVGYAGFLLGQLKKRKAVSKTYGEVQPVLSSLRALIDTDPLRMPTEFQMRRSEASYSLNEYEQKVRAL